MADAKKTETDTRLRTQLNTPKTNIVKIVTLTGEQRARYLGGIQQLSNSTREAFYDVSVNYKLRTFYGFIKQGAIQGMKITPKWVSDTTGGGLMGSIKDVVTATIDPSGGGAAKMFNAASTLANDLTGISMSVTGSSSLKRFTGVDLGGFNIQCGWSVREQLDQCRNELMILTRMAYPVQAEQQNILKVLDGVVKSSGKLITDTASILGPVGASAISGATKGVDAIVTNGASAIMNMANLFGNNFTVDPIPVRVMVGNYIDLEPLVIDDVSVSFSKENFRADDGYDYPLTVDVTIAFSFWLTPAPKLEFMKFLGQEMFGPNADAKLTAMYSEILAQDPSATPSEKDSSKTSDAIQANTFATSDSALLTKPGTRPVAESTNVVTR